MLQYLYWILLVNNNLGTRPKSDYGSVNILLAYPYSQQTFLKRQIIIQFTVNKILLAEG
jgi:hypothetical protein